MTDYRLRLKKERPIAGGVLFASPANESCQKWLADHIHNRLGDFADQAVAVIDSGIAQEFVGLFKRGADSHSGAAARRGRGRQCDRLRHQVLLGSVGSVILSPDRKGEGAASDRHVEAERDTRP